MADPLTWAIIGATTAVAGTIAGTTTGIISGIQNQRQQEANAEAQQEMANYNAQLEQREADSVLKETEAADQRQRDEQARFRAAQRALYGKSGAAMTAGSPLAVLGETAATHQIESSDLRRQGAAEYNRHMAQKQNLIFQGNVAKKSVNRNSMYLGIGSSLASGIGSLGSTLIAGAGAYDKLKK